MVLMRVNCTMRRTHIDYHTIAPVPDQQAGPEIVDEQGENIVDNTYLNMSTSPALVGKHVFICLVCQDGV